MERFAVYVFGRQEGGAGCVLLEEPSASKQVDVMGDIARGEVPLREVDITGVATDWSRRKGDVW